MIVAGVGCRANATAEEIEAIIRTATASHDLDVRVLDAIATETSKAAEPGLVATAARLTLPIKTVAKDEIEAVLPRVLTHSARVTAAKGVPSIAEATALVAAGPGARLLGPRHANATATCAIAVRDHSPGDAP